MVQLDAGERTERTLRRLHEGVGPDVGLDQLPLRASGCGWAPPVKRTESGEPA
jgi:hypothetical protein